MPPPEAVTDDDDGSDSVLKIDLTDLPPELWRNAEQREKVSRHLVAIDSLGNSFARQIGVPPVNGC
jgi:hypothetical protein